MYVSCACARCLDQGRLISIIILSCPCLDTEWGLMCTQTQHKGKDLCLDIMGNDVLGQSIGIDVPGHNIRIHV